MKEDNHIVSTLVLPYVSDVRRDHYVLGALAQSMTEPSVWLDLQQRAGDMTADEYEEHMMRNSKDDNSIATSAIELRWASDDES